MKMNTLSRRAERALSATAAVALAIGAYALGATNSHGNAAPKPKAVATAPAHSNNLHPVTHKATERSVHPTPTVSPSKVPSPSASPVLKKVDLEPPLTPTGGEYNTAENAAFSADQGDFASAEAGLAGITDPAIRAQTEHAIQEAYAADAAYNADNGNVTTALTDLGHVTLGDVRPAAVEAVDYGIAEDAAFAVTNGNDYSTAKSLEADIANPSLVTQVEQTITLERAGNTDAATNTWDSMYTTASSDWDNLYNQANTEWDTLYRHSDSYLQEYNQAP